MNKQHCCGQSLTLVLRPMQHDVTAYQDVPLHLRDSRGLPATPLDRLPLEYHKYITIGEIIGWSVENVKVYTCPTCHASLPSGVAHDAKDLAEYLKESGIQT